ncbi:phospholipid methyltransferase [Thelephora ganbajun]|uniref:Phospholipid methyltransferase n=1 Tax=Thelephora ganbajun TaxID=370292 RepID=A0ACB6Z687_THEGA|nr:phospholipid methyltransferase [Thelephora ganbajun]
MSLLKHVDFSKPSLYRSLALIAFNPTAWNIVARNEYRNKTITKIFGGNTKNGCYFLATSIFFAGMLRDNVFQKAIAEQPHVQLLPEPLNVIIPAVLVGLGQLFVVTSTWQLGITGTFLGDYFGILMDHRVEGFPFNVLRDPMYVGSTMTFVGASLWYESPVGLLISLYIYTTYVIALWFEGPFTDMIYSNRETKKDL